MSRKIYFFPLLILALIIGCKTIEPIPPSAAYTPFVLKPELSQINIPIEIASSKIETSINRQLTGLLYEDANLNDDDMAMKVWKKDNISFTMVGEEFRYKVPLKVWMKAGFKVEKFGMEVSDYEESEFALSLNFITKIAIDPNWNVVSYTTMSGYEWINKPSLDYGLIKIPLTYFADKVIAGQQRKLSNVLDDQIKKFVDLKKYANEAWTQVQDPIALNDDPKSWLQISPQEIQMTPVMGRAGLIQTTIGIKAYSQVHMGEKPATKTSALPKLKLVNDETGFFSIFLVSDIFYDYAEQLAKKYFEGQVYSFKDGKKNIKVESINLYGNQKNIIIALKISGSLKGTIYLNGVPYYDAPTQSIKVKNVDFDIDTKNKLIKSADWLAHGVFIKKIEPNLSFSMKETLDESRKLLEQGLTNNRIDKNIVINGRLTQLVPKDIYLSEESLKAVIIIKGIMNVEIDGLE